MRLNLTFVIDRNRPSGEGSGVQEESPELNDGKSDEAQGEV